MENPIKDKKEIKRMSITEKQYIEIAEKIWDWKLVPINPFNPDGKEVWIGEKNNDSISNYREIIGYPEDINFEDYILSWKGFGRTVEKFDLPVYGNARDKFIELYKDYLRGLHSKEVLWEQTHIAGLEAIKNNENL